MRPRPLTVADLAHSPNPLAASYSRFRVAERLLLTGHSHQAWPDAGLEGQSEAWNDAAELVDEKWGRAMEKADEVRRGYARLLGTRPEEIALGQNTHELVTRFLSALPLDRRPRLVTTDGEFHTIRRQMDRLAEVGRLEIARVAADPVATLAERLAAAVDARTAAVLVSSVLFGTARIVPNLGALAEACRRSGAELLVDAYHQVNVVPVDLARDGIAGAFVAGGGYKYCQLGEGVAFLRVPPGRDDLRPVLTGWYSEFARLTQRTAGEVPYGEGPARWAGATYDPTSHYRAARVFAFFGEQGLTAALLREISQHQVGALAHAFDALDLDPGAISRDRDVPLAALAGFLALRSPNAGALSAALQQRGVLTDHRGDLLRLGPAPYLSDGQLHAAMSALGEVVRAGAAASSGAAPAPVSKPAPRTVHDFSAVTIDGVEQPLSAYKGKVILIVNTASKCGYTPQYEGLEALFRKYRDRGLVVLGFPANNFMGQEPGSNAEIKAFCSTKCQITFPLFAKISVKGTEIHPLYAFLTRDSGFKGDVSWNFNKFLVGPDGKVVARFGSGTDPLGEELTTKLESALSGKRAS
ncbi:MAG: aminotransferase class V-fold PLP-dependent enzyme [Candidatus Eisenbacteria bacterium]